MKVCQFMTLAKLALLVWHLAWFSFWSNSATWAPLVEFVWHLTKLSTWLLFVMGFLDSANFLTNCFYDSTWSFFSFGNSVTWPLLKQIWSFLHLTTHCIWPFINLAIKMKILSFLHLATYCIWPLLREIGVKLILKCHWHLTNYLASFASSRVFCH